MLLLQVKNCQVSSATNKLVTDAGDKCLFDYSLRFTNPIRFAELVATLFKSVGLGQADFAAQAQDPAVKLMLCLLENMKDMSPSWHKKNLEAVLTRMMQLEPEINVLFSKVTAHSVMDTGLPINLCNTSHEHISVHVSAGTSVKLMCFAYVLKRLLFQFK